MSSSNWDGAAQQLNFSDARAMWQEFYVKRNMSIDDLARRFGVSQGMIRGQIVRAGITIKARGGANYRKIEVTDELRARCEKEGTKLVADELGVSYTALHKALKRTAPIATQTEAEAEPQTPPVSEVRENGE